ncbi:MAG: hypothetical protein EZS26_001668 [Candidatus Ordinivivax streblomastigis]|uniref:Uncharacterized protein n=1 Tax=Candidatus Ordinivivax streblomastigis TaxID=2540710 RepID=A0A5M8P0W4_9BACT|nr:MAG: hypothetical protein EZS26_001668 [Candidatus Ordinivivax streblomastigis]
MKFKNFKLLYLDANSVKSKNGLSDNKYISAALVRFNNLWQVNGLAAFLSGIEGMQNEENIRFYSGYTYSDFLPDRK